MLLLQHLSIERQCRVYGCRWPSEPLHSLSRLVFPLMANDVCNHLAIDVFARALRQSLKSVHVRQVVLTKMPSNS